MGSTGWPKQDPSKNLLDALLLRAEQVLGFVDDLSGTFTNNLLVGDPGAAPFTSQIVESIFNVIMNNNLAKYGGDIAVSNFGSVLSLYVLILMPIFGISQGIQAIIGFNYGAKKFGRVRETLTTATLIATLIAVFFFIIIRLFPGQVIAVFNHDPRFIQSGTYMMGIVMLTLPILGFQSIGSSYFQAVGKSVQAIFLSLARQVLFLIPALLILPHLLQLFGVLISIPIADILATTVTGILLFFGLRQPHKHNATGFPPRLT